MLCFNKGFTSNLIDIFYEDNCGYNSYKFSHKFSFIAYLFFLKNQKQESNFQQVDGLVTRNVIVFCL